MNNIIFRESQKIIYIVNLKRLVKSKVLKLQKTRQHKNQKDKHSLHLLIRIQQMKQEKNLMVLCLLEIQLELNLTSIITLLIKRLTSSLIIYQKMQTQWN